MKSFSFEKPEKNFNLQKPPGSILRQNVPVSSLSAGPLAMVRDRLISVKEPARYRGLRLLANIPGTLDQRAAWARLGYGASRFSRARKKQDEAKGRTCRAETRKDPFNNILIHILSPSFLFL